MNSIVKNTSILALFILCQLFHWQLLDAQNVNYIPLNTSATVNSKGINTSLASGAIPASATVVETGGATYSIPIAVPPGTNEVAPGIAITYNSMMGNGVLGQGWSITGLSSITRSGQTFHFDNKKTPVNFTPSDRFYLDGMRLTLRSGTYGWNGSTYRKEVEDFAIVTAYGSMGGSPQHFKVEMKDGTVMEYGNSSDSRFLNQNNTEVLIWRLNKISYKDGNYIEFFWTSGYRDNRIYEIKYTGNSITGQAPYNLVRFHYKVRTDQVTTYEAGSSMVGRYLLDRIEVKSELNTFKDYEFRYSSDGFRSLLNSVKEKGSDGTALNTTIFKYGNQPLGFSTQSLSIFQNQSVDLFSGDFDGDGYTDILTSPVNYQGSIRYNTSLRLFCRSATNPAYSLVYNHNLPSASTVVNGMNVPNFNNLASSDFTGDGRDDIMTMNVNIGGSQNWRILDKLTLHQYSAGSFLRTFYFPPANFNLVSPSFQYFYPGDFNGDGITDFILILSNATGYKAFMTLGGATNVRNAEITGIGTSPYAAAAWAFADDIRVLDFDGDGKMELMVIDENNTKIHTFTQNGSSISTQVLYNAGFPTKYHHVYFGDFNGDRKTDLLVRGSLTNNSQAWEKAISTGTSFAVSSFSFNRTPDVVGNSGDDKIEIGDFNGDGRTDVLHGWNYTTNSDLEVYYSRGNAFTSEKYGFNGLLGFVPLTQYDLNGDGRADLINRTSFSSPSTIFYFKKEGQEQLLQTVVDGHLKRTNFSYRRMTQTSNFYSKDSFSPYPLNRVSIPIYLTQQMQEDNGNGGYYTTQYKYKDALLLRSGKGFLGFKEFEAIDLTNNVRTTLANDVVAPQVYIMVPKTIRKFVNSTNYNFNTILYNQGYVPLTNNSYWVRTNGMTEYLNLQGQTKTMSSTFDNDGNVLEEVKSDGVETITTTIAYGQFGGPRPNKPTEITVNRQRAGQLPHIVTDRYTYNNKGQVMTQVKYAGLPRQVTTLFNYNSLGNVSGKTMTALGVALRTTAQTYDSRGRFIISDTNPVGQSETATYDVKWGKPLSTTGVDGLTATYAYDGFGRLIQTTLPTGVIINESYPFFINSSYGSTYCHQVTQPGKPDQWVYFDKLGRKVRHRRKTFGNADIFEVWTYDSRGRLKTSRAPYKTGESTFTTTYNYDSYNRRISEATPFGTTSYVYSYASGIAKLTKTNPAGHVSSVEMDASGRKIKATDNGGTLTYTYDSQGEAKEIKLGGITMVTMTHDAYGNKVQVVDKNAGTISYDYNAFKEMTSQTNANGHTYNMEYNKLGQITRRQGPGEDRRYVYHTTGAAKNKLFNIYNIQSTDREYYYYDAFGRVRLKMERIDGPYLSTFFAYNSQNDLIQKTFPSGLILDYTYDANGILSSIEHTASNHTLFTNQGMNGRGQYTSYELGNNKTTDVTYVHGIPTRYRAIGVQDYLLNWNYATGNLNYRYNALTFRSEGFTYDNLNRLKTAQVSNNQPVKSVAYLANGNISSKTDVGSYLYASGRNNAVARVTNTSNTIPTVVQDISYTEFDQPAEISEGDFELNYTYGHDRQRIKSVLKENGFTVATRWYLGDFERQTKQGATKDIHYINAGQGMVAIVVKHNNAYQFYYTYTDHLGSILKVTDDSGTIVAEQNFDPWGRKRNSFSWNYVNVNSVPDWLYRGYTGHEEMPEFNLINMNGRLYDPVVGRMLSPDNHIQSPGNTQSYNRYTYVFNNPLSYTDPTGEIAWFVPVIIGAAVGAYAGASIASNSWNFTKWTSDAWKGAIVGAFVGAAFGAMSAAGLGATGIKMASGSLTKAWSITTSAIKGANIKMAVTAMTGGDLDKVYKAGLVGAVLGAYKGAYDVTKGFGIDEKWGWLVSFVNKAAYTGLESIGSNIINGDDLFYGFILQVGFLRFSFGEKYKDDPIWRWQDNIGSILPEAVTMVKWIGGGTPGVDWSKLSLSSDGGWFDTLPKLSKIEKSVGFNGKDAMSLIGQIFSKLGAS